MLLLRVFHLNHPHDRHSLGSKWNPAFLGSVPLVSRVQPCNNSATFQHHEACLCSLLPSASSFHPLLSPITSGKEEKKKRERCSTGLRSKEKRGKGGGSSSTTALLEALQRAAKTAAEPHESVDACERNMYKNLCLECFNQTHQRSFMKNTGSDPQFAFHRVSFEWNE